MQRGDPPWPRPTLPDDDPARFVSVELSRVELVWLLEALGADRRSPALHAPASEHGRAMRLRQRLLAALCELTDSGARP